MLWTRTKTTPLFYAERLRRMFTHDPDRVERALQDPDSLDLLTWNLFASLDTDEDREYLAGQLRVFCGSDIAPPVSISLFSGTDIGPRLEPSSAYVHHIRERAGEGGDISAFTRPIEVPVHIESRSVLGLVDTMWDTAKRGSGGRDRLVELIDAGLVQAERVGKELAVAVVYRSGTPAAGELSRRINELRATEALRAALPWRRSVPPVRLREVTWQQLVNLWEHERRQLKLFGEPVKDFQSLLADRGLR